MNRMSYNYIIMLLCFAGWIFQSCNSDELPTQNASKETSSIRIKIDIKKILFDSIAINTRSVVSWENGEEIHLVIQDESSEAYGTATYDANYNDWDFKYTGTLPQNSASIQAVYFDQPISITNTDAPLTPTMGIYCDTEGIFYNGENGALPYVKLSLKPYTSRIRFKGVPGTPLTIKGINTYSNYHLSTGLFLLSSKEIITTVGQDGYTPYLYGLFFYSTNRSLTITHNGNVFRTDCPQTVMNIGTSGWMNLPTVSQHEGWQMSILINEHEYIDLGLPSGTLWATCNIGASTPEEYGDYYAWGETATKDIYDWNTYKWCNGTKDYMTKYCTNSDQGKVDNKNELDLEDDVAFIEWGECWRTPDWHQFLELQKECSWQWTELHGVKGYKVISKYNGNSIFFPAASLCDSSGELGVEDPSEFGLYLSRSLAPSLHWNSWSMNFDSKYFVYGMNIQRYIGASVRPVYQKNNVHEYVDLGLPSGNLWATCNVGASTPEEYGDYYAWGETETKDIYDLDTYKWYNHTFDSYTKYDEDNKETLDLEDDVAWLSRYFPWQSTALTTQISECNGRDRRVSHARLLAQSGIPSFLS